MLYGRTVGGEHPGRHARHEHDVAARLRSASTGRTSRARWCAARAWTARTRSSSAGSVSATERPRLAMPAACTRMSTAPKSASTVARHAARRPRPRPPTPGRSGRDGPAPRRAATVASAAASSVAAVVRRPRRSRPRPAPARRPGRCPGLPPVTTATRVTGGPGHGPARVTPAGTPGCGTRRRAPRTRPAVPSPPRRSSGSHPTHVGHHPRPFGQVDDRGHVGDLVP